MKYRIFKRQDYYIIKKKGWFFWRTIKEVHVDAIGGFYEGDMRFGTLESAHLYVQARFEQKEKDLLLVKYE